MLIRTMSFSVLFFCEQKERSDTSLFFHYYIELNKKSHIGYSKNGKFKKIIMDNKYEFKTIAALAKFLQVSESQVQRYISGETKSEHTFQFIY